MSAINDLINAYITRNANQEITGPVLNGVLNAMANALDTPYIGPNGDWYVYDPALGQFVDSGNSSTLFNQVVVDVLNTYGTPGCNVVISGGTLYMEFENLKGDPGPEGPAGPAGVTSATASVDANTGTPSVDVNVVSQVLQLAFHNLKGAQGNPGTPGAAAGFGTPTASVDANTGTPSVAVTASGPDTAKVFDFAFHNLKGATGSPGTPGAAAGFGTPTASVDANTGTPSVAVTASGPDTAKVFDFAFHNLKGETGATGATGPAGPAKFYVGTCSTAAATAEKECTVEAFPVDGNGKPIVGTVIAVKFTNTNSAASPTINANNTGAASIWYDAAAYTASSNIGGYAGRYTFFMWDGTYWCWQTWGVEKDADTNTIAYQIRTYANGILFKSSTYRYRLLFTSPDGTQLIPSNTSTSTSATAAKTVNQDPFDPFGPIWYYNYTSAVPAGTAPSAARMWLQYSGIALGYAFNTTGAALTMTPFAPIYLKCAPQSDGTAIMDSTTPIVQTLPSTDDGKIYIFLGYAESATAATLYNYHPVYYYRNGSIREWSNDSAPVTSLSAANTDTEVPSAKCVWDLIGDVETLINAL